MTSILSANQLVTSEASSLALAELPVPGQAVLLHASPLLLPWNPLLSSCPSGKAGHFLLCSKAAPLADAHQSFF